MRPTAVAFGSDAVFGRLVNGAARWKGESSHGGTVLGGLEGVNPSEGAGAPWEGIYNSGKMYSKQSQANTP